MKTNQKASPCLPDSLPDAIKERIKTEKERAFEELGKLQAVEWQLLLEKQKADYTKLEDTQKEHREKTLALLRNLHEKVTKTHQKHIAYIPCALAGKPESRSKHIKK